MPGQRRLTMIALSLALLLSMQAVPGAALAGPDTQGVQGQLALFGPPVQGLLDANTPQASYLFHARAGQPISLRAVALSGDLSLDLVLFGPAGDGLARGVPALSAPRTLIIDAFIPPADGTYSVTASALSGSSGQYEVRLLGGYAELAVLDDFSNGFDPLRLEWSPFVTVDVAADVVDGALGIQVLNKGRLGCVEPDRWSAYSDLYIQADFTIEDTPGYHEYGFALRLARGTSAFYALIFSSEGDWALFYYDGAWHTVQDWTVSPAIDASDRTPRIGVFVQDSTFRVYFNDREVGAITDDRPFALEGGIGLVAGTSPDEQGILVAYVDNLAVTTPAAPYGAMARVGTAEVNPSAP